MVQINPRYIKSLRTRAERARKSALVLRKAAEKPHNEAIKSRLLEWADKDHLVAQRALARIHQLDETPSTARQRSNRLTDPLNGRLGAPHG